MAGSEDTESRRLFEVVAQFLRGIREEGKREIVRLLAVAGSIQWFREDGNDERVPDFELVVAHGDVLDLSTAFRTVVNSGE